MSNSGYKTFGTLEPVKPPRRSPVQQPRLSVFDVSILTKVVTPYHFSIPSSTIMALFESFEISHPHWDKIEMEVYSSEFYEAVINKKPRLLKVWSNILRHPQITAPLKSVDLEIDPHTRMLVIRLTVDLLSYTTSPLDHLTFHEFHFKGEWGIVPTGTPFERNEIPVPSEIDIEILKGHSRQQIFPKAWDEESLPSSRLSLPRLSIMPSLRRLSNWKGSGSMSPSKRLKDTTRSLHTELSDYKSDRKLVGSKEEEDPDKS
jgi:hypothetical protein